MCRESFVPSRGTRDLLFWGLQTALWGIYGTNLVIYMTARGCRSGANTSSLGQHDENKTAGGGGGSCSSEALHSLVTNRKETMCIWEAQNYLRTKFLLFPTHKDFITSKWTLGTLGWRSAMKG